MENLEFNALKVTLHSINSAFAASQNAKQNEEAYRLASDVSEQNLNVMQRLLPEQRQVLYRKS